MNVMVTGGSGFVGKAVVEALKKAGHTVHIASRATGVNLANPEATIQAVQQLQPEAIIHLVGIIKEKGDQTFSRVHVQATQNIVQAARAVNARYVHMSALGAKLDSQSLYSSTKAQAEEIVKKSGLNYTIFQPSLIFGVGDDFFGNVLKGLVSSAPFVPVIGDGGFKFRPVWVGDVASAFVQALTLPETVGKTYLLVGKTEYTFKELLQAELKALSLSKPLLHVPLALMNVAVPLMQMLPNPPITRHQYAMLLEGNTGDPAPALQTFQLTMPSLEEWLSEIIV